MAKINKRYNAEKILANRVLKTVKQNIIKQIAQMNEKQFEQFLNSDPTEVVKTLGWTLWAVLQGKANVPGM